MYYHGESPRFNFEWFIDHQKESYKRLRDVGYNGGRGLDDASKCLTSNKWCSRKHSWRMIFPSLEPKEYLTGALTTWCTSWKLRSMNWPSRSHKYEQIEAIESRQSVEGWNGEEKEEAVAWTEIAIGTSIKIVRSSPGWWMGEEFTTEIIPQTNTIISHLHRGRPRCMTATDIFYLNSRTPFE